MTTGRDLLRRRLMERLEFEGSNSMPQYPARRTVVYVEFGIGDKIRGAWGWVSDKAGQAAGYVRRGGRVVQEPTRMEPAVNQYVGDYSSTRDDSIGDRMETMTDRLISGRMRLQDWHDGMKQTIKDAHIASACMGRGGRNAMTQSDWGRVGARLRQEYGYLRQFANEINQGQLTPAQVLARAKQYSSSMRTSFYDGTREAMKEVGLDEMRRVLDPAADHCGDCPEYAAAGWGPMGHVPPPGIASECGARCRCTEEYR